MNAALEQFAAEHLPAGWSLVWGGTTAGCRGNARPSSRTIHIESRRWWIRDLLWTLAHEIAHAIARDFADEHNAAWRREINRLFGLLRRQHAAEISARPLVQITT